MIIDAFILVLIGTIYGMYKNRNKSGESETRRDISYIEKLWIFGKYYTIAFFLVFNANVAFSSLLTLHNASSPASPVSGVNIFFSVVVLMLSVAFFVGLYLWTKELSTAIVYPEPVEYSTHNNERNNERLDGSSAIISVKSHRSRPVSQRNESRN